MPRGPPRPQDAEEGLALERLSADREPLEAPGRPAPYDSPDALRPGGPGGASGTGSREVLLLQQHVETLRRYVRGVAGLAARGAGAAGAARARRWGGLGPAREPPLAWNSPAGMRPAAFAPAGGLEAEIGRASCRERV